VSLSVTVEVTNLHDGCTNPFKKYEHLSCPWVVH
jgi:hypothetical protein